MKYKVLSIESSDVSKRHDTQLDELEKALNDGWVINRVDAVNYGGESAFNRSKLVYVLIKA